MDSDALARDGMAALRRGDAADARRMFEAVTATGNAPVQPWLLLAQSCTLLNDEGAARVALDQALAIEPRNIYALLMRGDAFARARDDRAASAWYELALSMVPARAALPPDLSARLATADSWVAQTRQRFRAHLEEQLSLAGVSVEAAGPRFAESLAILSGERQLFLQSPTSFYYPGLAHAQFFEATEFSWVAALEAAAPAIREELLAVLDDDRGVKPYVEADPTRPDKGHALVGDPSWSAFHLFDKGLPLSANAERCPRTMDALASLPIPRIRDRSPMALFSILRAGTHIAPHCGMLNTRLIVHLPLIVPDGCRLRVGNETRPVIAGKTMIFDDSIEHEAWNDGTATRVVLLFEIWRPELSLAERMALTAMFNAIGSY